MKELRYYMLTMDKNKISFKRAIFDVAKNQKESKFQLGYKEKTHSHYYLLNREKLEKISKVKSFVDKKVFYEFWTLEKPDPRDVYNKLLSAYRKYIEKKIQALKKKLEILDKEK